MPTYIAMLRGINVSGQKKIKMADLRSHLSNGGLSDVETYIQSGNIVFRSDHDPRVLEDTIHQIIEDHYGFDVPTMVRLLEEFQYVLSNNPLLKDPAKDHGRLYITFLDEVPSKEKVEALKEFDYSPEEYVIKDRVVFFYSPHGYGKAKMSNNFFEDKLKVRATSRNWKTVSVLYEMATK